MRATTEYYPVTPESIIRAKREAQAERDAMTMKHIIEVVVEVEIDGKEFGPSRENAANAAFAHLVTVLNSMYIYSPNTKVLRADWKGQR